MTLLSCVEASLLVYFHSLSDHTHGHQVVVLQAGKVYASKMYLSVLKAHAALHEGLQAVALVKQMRALGLQLGRSTYSHMVQAFCNGGALQVQKAQKFCDVQTNLATYAVCLLLLHYCVLCIVISGGVDNCPIMHCIVLCCIGKD